MSEAEEKAKRVRSLLSAYYTSGSGDGGGASRAAASIDSAAFDAEAYVTSLVRLPTTAAALRSARAARAPRSRSLLPLAAEEDALGPAAQQVCVHVLRDSRAGQRRAGARARLFLLRLRITATESCVLQMLVYENYSKFITATDTIRRMKDNVEEMGGRMSGECQLRKPTPL